MSARGKRRRVDLKCEAHLNSAETKITVTFGTCDKPDCLPASLVLIFPLVKAYLRRKPRARA